MAPSGSRNSLQPPRKSVEMEDSGAGGLESSEDEYFSDASEGRRRPSDPQQTPLSPIPRTRVERVDDEPAHGEEPGTNEYGKRKEDAVPDEIEVVPEGGRSKRNSRQHLDLPVSPGGSAIPRTVVEKLDPSSTSYGDEPGTEAYKKRLADAAPDVVLKNPDPTKGSRYDSQKGHGRSPSGRSIPQTIVTRVGNEPARGEAENTRARGLRSQDAQPDMLEVRGDMSGSPTLNRSLNDNDEDDIRDNDFGDDFDDFEEGAQADADDDFGDFGEEFEMPVTPAAPLTPLPDGGFPPIDSDTLSSLPDLLESTQIHLDSMFPTTTSLHLDSMPPPPTIPHESPIFPSERSRSLWHQLITPPPLQPPNWTQSRIRRLFLISLGVPVDLDEILPPSKQKKLVLPGINLDSANKADSPSLARLKDKNQNSSSASLDSSAEGKSEGGTTTVKKPRTKRAVSRLPPAPPALDLQSVKRLCATTDEKLDSLSDAELKTHTKELESMMARTQELLEYWLKRRDGLRKEKEAFEGVIENLVRHARRVRK